MTEKLSARLTSDIAGTGVNVVDAMVKKAWSVIDAASEKKSPNEILSQQGVKNIQGFRPE